MKCMKSGIMQPSAKYNTILVRGMKRWNPDYQKLKTGFYFITNVEIKINYKNQLIYDCLEIGCENYIYES